jgi:hypothetical protein
MLPELLLIGDKNSEIDRELTVLFFCYLFQVRILNRLICDYESFKLLLYDLKTHRNTCQPILTAGHRLSHSYFDS